MAEDKPAPSVVITLRVPQKTKDSIDALKERVGAKQIGDLISFALATYDALSLLEDRGHALIIRDEKGDETRLVLRPLGNLWQRPE